MTLAALFVTYGGATAFGYFTGKTPVYLKHTNAQHTSTVAGPWSVIKAYYNDITMRDYRAAWQLRADRLRGQGYANWVAGYADTGRQTVRKISLSGDQVTFKLWSDNPDGTVQTFWGIDTVTGGKIMTAHVVQTGGPA